MKLPRLEREIYQLPASLREAVKALEICPVILENLGEHIAENFMKAKRLEYQDYLKYVSQWEIDPYIVYHCSSNPYLV